MLKYTLLTILSVSSCVVLIPIGLELTTEFVIPVILFSLCIIGWIKFSQFSKFRKLLVIYISVTCLNEIFSYYSGLWYNTNGLVYNIYSWVQLVLFGFIFFETLSWQKYIFVLLTSITSILVIDVTLSFYNSIHEFPSLNLTLLGAFVLTVSLVQFNQMVKKPTERVLEKQPIFWFTLGNFIFYNLTFFTFGFLASHQDLPEWIFLILEGANIFLFSTYFIALILDQEPKPIDSDTDK